MSTTLFSHHYVRTTFLELNFRYLLFNFIRATVSSSNSSRTKIVTNIFKEEDDEKISISTMQEYNEKHIDF